MQTLVYDYQDKQIEFLLSGDMMVNATEMAAVYGKRVSKFLENKETQNFIDKLKKTPIGENKGAEFGPFLSQFKDLNPEKVVKSPNGVPILITIPGREGATWMHRWLAIDFAMWLDLDFKVWIIAKIDYLLINFSNRHRELINQEQQLKREKYKLLQENKNNPVALRIAEIDEELRAVTHRKGSVTKYQYGIWNNQNI